MKLSVYEKCKKEGFLSTMYFIYKYIFCIFAV